MKDLINRVQQQLDNNHAVEADDIQALVDYANQFDSKMKVDRYYLKDRIEHVIGEGVANTEEIDTTTQKVMDEIELLIRAVDNDANT